MKRVMLPLAGIPISTFLLAEAAPAQDFRAIEETRPWSERPHVEIRALPTPGTGARVLVAGDSWAQYMWDDGSHNDVFDRFGHADKQAISRSLDSNPGPGYVGPEYAVSGSAANEWVDTANYPWIANMVADLEANPDVDTVLLSLGGNDVLAGKSGGGWYKDMDLDVPGSEQAFFEELEANTFTIVQAALAVRPDIEVIISSYDYPNFNVGFWCFLFACPLRENLSRDPVADLITDAELNEMILVAEQRRIDWAAAWDRVLYDNSVGLMHHAYGDGVSPPGVLPKPGLLPPDYLPFPGGNPLLPSLRENFRQPGGIDADPIHLDFEGYQYKITHQTEGFFWPEFRGSPAFTFASEGGDRDGWTDGTQTGVDDIRFGDTGSASVYGLLSFDTSALPAGAIVSSANLYLTRDTATGSNPLISGALGAARADVVAGSFGGPEVEPGDASASADALDGAWFHGSVREDHYALRIELQPDALFAVNDEGLTQIRISFPGVDAGSDQLVFRDGDAPPLVTEGPPVLAEILGASVPFLDVELETPSSVAATTETGLRLLPSAPNPFRGSTTLRFELPRATRVRVSVHDVAGRLVAVLVDGGREAGVHSVSWDGRDRSGSAVASGTYWARLSSDLASEAVRMVRIRGR